MITQNKTEIDKAKVIGLVTVAAATYATYEMTKAGYGLKQIPFAAAGAGALIYKNLDNEVLGDVTKVDNNKYFDIAALGGVIYQAMDLAKHGLLPKTVLYVLGAVVLANLFLLVKKED